MRDVAYERILGLNERALSTEEEEEEEEEEKEEEEKEEDELNISPITKKVINIIK